MKEQPSAISGQQVSQQLLGICDKLHRATHYLANSWGVDTPPAEMKANLDARLILIKLQRTVMEVAKLEYMYSRNQP